MVSNDNRLTGDWTPRRQAMAYEHVLDSIARARHTVAEFTEVGQQARDLALRSAATALLDNRAELDQANQADLADARAAGMPAGGLARLALTTQRVDELADHLTQVAGLPSPLTADLPDRGQHATVPLGVVGVVYEPQPATTVLASASLLKAGNAVLLRGSAAAARTDAALVARLHEGLLGAGLAAAAVQTLSVAERATIRYLVGAHGLVDLVLLRAGRSLARQARAEASVPLVELGHGICHVYLDAAADPEQALRLALDATLTDPDRTGAAHTILVHRDAVPGLLPPLVAGLIRAGVLVRGDQAVASSADGVVLATADDWRDEYLTLEVAVRVVESFDVAVEHINEFGTGHTEVIVTGNRLAARSFAARVNAATIGVNTTTRPDELFVTQKHFRRGPLSPAMFTTSKQIAWPA